MHAATCRNGYTAATSNEYQWNHIFTTKVYHEQHRMKSKSIANMLPSFHLYTCMYVSYFFIFQHEPSRISSIDFRHSGEERCSRKLVALSTPARTTEEKSAFLAGLQHVFPKAAVLSSFFSTAKYFYEYTCSRTSCHDCLSVQSEVQRSRSQGSFEGV